MFQFAYRGTSGVPIIKLLPVAASQSLSKGDPVSLSSGKVVAGAAADSAFVGVMNQDADNLDENTLVEVIICDSETVFYVDYIKGTKTSLTAADIGTAFDLDSSDPSSINLDDTTDGAWVVEKYDNTLGKAWVRCLASKRSTLAN